MDQSKQGPVRAGHCRDDRMHIGIRWIEAAGGPGLLECILSWR